MLLPEAVDVTEGVPLRDGVEDLEADGLHALAISSNSASEKILLKLGMKFTEERAAENPGGPTVMDRYYILRK